MRIRLSGMYHFLLSRSNVPLIDALIGIKYITSFGGDSLATYQTGCLPFSHGPFNPKAAVVLPKELC